MDVGFDGFTRRSHRRCRHVGTLENSRNASDSTVLLHHPVLLGDDHNVRQVVKALRKVDYAAQHSQLSELGVSNA